MEEEVTTTQELRGAKPYYVVTTERINELLSAIGRYVNYSRLTEDRERMVKLWAVELTEQIRLLTTLEIYDT